MAVCVAPGGALAFQLSQHGYKAYAFSRAVSALANLHMVECRWGGER